MPGTLKRRGWKEPTTGRDHHGAGVQPCSCRGGYEKPASGLRRDFGDFLAQVEGGVEGLRLFEQPVDQFLGAADRQRGNVVNRLVGIELRALAADLVEGIDDVGADAEKPELEDLEQSDGTRTDDDDFRRDGFGRGR